MHHLLFASFCVLRVLLLFEPGVPLLVLVPKNSGYPTFRVSSSEKLYLSLISELESTTLLGTWALRVGLQAWGWGCGVVLEGCIENRAARHAL